MTTPIPPIMFAVTAAMLIGAACPTAQVKDEAEDVKDAREDVKEEKEELKEEQQELEEQKAEFAADLDDRIAKAEKRYAELGLRADKIIVGEVDNAAEKEIESARQKAKTEIDDLRKATPTSVESDLEQLDQAMDKYDELLDNYEDI